MSALSSGTGGGEDGGPTLPEGAAHVHKIIGAPGAGKSHKLLEIAKSEADRGVAFTEMYYATYTRAGKREAADALRDAYSQDDPDKVGDRARTLHALAFLSCRDAGLIDQTASGSAIGDYPRRGRARKLAVDIGEIIADGERALYATTSFNAPEAFKTYPLRWNPDAGDDGETEWYGLDRGESPTPDAAATWAVAAWGDIDLCDDEDAPRGDLKKKRRTEGLSDEEQRIVEQALAAYAREFAALYGVDVESGAIHGLDSVGGAYFLGPPEATVPMRHVFGDDEDAQRRVVRAFVERSNRMATRRRKTR